MWTSIKENTKEFYRLTIIRSRQNEESHEPIVRYVNELRYLIKDEIYMMKFWLVVEEYQLALRAKCF